MSEAFDRLLVSVRISDLPRRKVCKVEPSTPLGEVYRQLDHEHGVAVLVCEGPDLVGIFTERDVLYRTALEGDADTPIRELMTPSPITLTADRKLVEAIRIMTEKDIRHLPMPGDDDNEAGLIGGRDVLKMIAEHFPETLLNLPPRLHQQMRTPEGG